MSRRHEPAYRKLHPTIRKLLDVLSDEEIDVLGAAYDDDGTFLGLFLFYPGQPICLPADADKLDAIDKLNDIYRDELASIRAASERAAWSAIARNLHNSKGGPHV